NYLKNIMEYTKKSVDIDTLIVGLSYSLFGIEAAKLRKQAVNLSLASQDMYYSFKILKELIDKNKSIKNCIIGVAYYSFHFDLSKGSEAFRIKDVYYPLFKDRHHYEILDEQNNREHDSLEKFVSNESRILLDINSLESKIMDLYYKNEGLSYFNSHIVRKNASLLGDQSLLDLTVEKKIVLGKDRAQRHNKALKHKETVKENEKVFSDMLKYLNKKNIKPIIVVFPTTVYYKDHLDSAFKEEFYNKLNTFKKEHIFSVVDLFERNDFNENDCLDLDHLDLEGAIKVTNILNNHLT
ncbi:hypothetical protein, partial [Bacillus manliponensis]